MPVVFVQVTDPVGAGLVASLARPGGNLTGFTSFEFSIGSKWLEMLKVVAPHVTRVALVFSPRTAPFADRFWGTDRSRGTFLRCHADPGRRRAPGLRSGTCWTRSRASRTAA